MDHYQIQRVIDVYVTPATEDLGRVANAIDKITARTRLPEGVALVMRGMVEGMRQSFRSFGFGLFLALALLYLVLVAQFRSFIDPFLILLAVPTGLTGVLLFLWITGTTMNVMSLMGVVMMVGMVSSNSILIVEFAHRLEAEMSVRDAVVTSCRIRLRPILMTSLATIFGLIPMALKLETGSEAYASLGRAIIGGLTSSVILTVFIVPAAYLLVYGRKKQSGGETPRRRTLSREANPTGGAFGFMVAPLMHRTRNGPVPRRDSSLRHRSANWRVMNRRNLLFVVLFAVGAALLQGAGYGPSRSLR